MPLRGGTDGEARVTPGTMEGGMEGSTEHGTEGSGRIDPVTTRERLRGVGYVASDPLATALALSAFLGRPLLVEGPAGVGKTSLAQAWAQALGSDLVRLSCYEGIGRPEALYEWDYPRQLLYLRATETHDTGLGQGRGIDLYGDGFLLARPLLRALQGQDAERPPVLLIDEVDRTDEAFEAFLLEILGEFQVTIPERGETVRAKVRPHVVLTSNRTRELSDALRRRCLYVFVDYPSPEVERAIVMSRIPGVPERLAREAVAAIGRIRALALEKEPGPAETLDFCRALSALGQEDLAGASPAAVSHALAAVAKSEEDREVIEEHLADVLGHGTDL